MASPCEQRCSPAVPCSCLRHSRDSIACEPCTYARHGMRLLLRLLCVRLLHVLMLCVCGEWLTRRPCHGTCHACHGHAPSDSDPRRGGPGARAGRGSVV